MKTSNPVVNFVCLHTGCKDDVKVSKLNKPCMYLGK